MGYHLAIFDFDGTLADSFRWFVGVVNRLADKHGFRMLDEDEIERLRGRDARRIVEHLDVPVWKLPWIARDARKLMAREIDGVSLFPGVRRMLGDLAGRGVALAIVTSNSARNVRRVLGEEAAGLIEHYGCDVGIFGKRSKLRRVIERSGVPREEAIYVGDEIRDVEAAHAERIAFGAVAWGYTRLESLVPHAPEEVFASIGEIAAKVAPVSP